MPKSITWSPALVQAFWGGVATTRLREMAFSRLAGDELTELLERHLDKAGTCLDFGGGSGELAEKLVAKGFRTAIYEPSEARTDLLPMSLRESPHFLGVISGKEEREFDAVLLIEVIEHILERDLESTLERVRSLARPGGRVVVTTPFEEDLELASAYCPQCDHLFHRWQHQRSFTIDSLTALLARYDFRPLACGRVDFSMMSRRLAETDSLRKEVRQLRRALERLEREVGLGPALRRALRRRKLKTVAVERGGERTGAASPFGPPGLGAGPTICWIGERIATPGPA